MPQSPIAAIETSVNKTHTWLKELSEIGHFENESQAYTALRAALHSIRDRLTVDEAAHLGAQLPMVVRGFYYEGWKPALAPNKERDRSAFIASVEESLRGADRIDPQQAISATFDLLGRKVSEGEMDDVKHMLPEEVRAAWA
jgi:uncharacterized protein (DUF2267 family)